MPPKKKSDEKSPQQPSGAPALFDESVLDEKPATTVPTTLEDLDLKALLRLRGEIDQLLPPRTIDEMNLEEEAVLQFHLAKHLMNETIASAAPANQKAQTMNTCAAILDTLAETQTALRNMETMKVMEQCLERAFNGTPVHVREAFYDRYKAALAAYADMKNARKS